MEEKDDFSKKIKRRDLIKKSGKLAGGAMLAGALLKPFTNIFAGTEEDTGEPSVEEGLWTPGNHFKGMNIYFEGGGPPGGPWCSIYINGARAAERDLGCNLTVTFADWNPEKMITNFKNAIAASPDGIVIMGHPGQDAFWPLVDQAEAKGIIITLANTPLPDIEAKYKGNGFGFVGQELYESGYLLGKASIDRYGLKAGDRGFVWGLLSQPTRGLRSKGTIDAWKEAGLKVDYLEISPDINAAPATGVPVFAGYVSSKPDVKVVCTDHGGLTGTLEAYLKGAGKGPDDIYAVGFDLSSAITEGLKNGYIDLVLDQQPFLQGYLPVLQIGLTKKYGFAGLHIDTGAGLIDKDNIDVVAPLAEKQVR
jgi:simple sugar transport system substrate-binding protein